MRQSVRFNRVIGVGMTKRIRNKSLLPMVERGHASHFSIETTNHNVGTMAAAWWLTSASAENGFAKSLANYGDGSSCPTGDAHDYATETRAERGLLNG